MLKTVLQFFCLQGGAETPVWRSGDSGLEPKKSGDSGLGRRLRSGRFQSVQNSNGTRFGRKNSNLNLRLMGEIKELGHGNAGEGRSTSLASNPRIKTYQNSLKSQIDPKHELGLFLVKFSNLWGKDQIDEKSVATKSC